MLIKEADLPRVVEQISPGRGQSERIVRLAHPVAGDATVVKVYKDGAAPDLAEARSLIRAGTRLETLYPVAHQRIAWPRAFVVSSSGHITGSALPMAPEEVFYRDGSDRHPCKIEHMIRPDSRVVRRAGLMMPDIGLRMRFCLALSAITSRIHDVGGLYGDFSQSNILWTCEPKGDTVCLPYLLDADGIVIGSHREDIHTANWKDEYPRSDGRADTATDVYKLAAMIFRVINLTFQLPPPGEYRLDGSQIPVQVASRLEPTINAALGPRAGRPSIQDFHGSLREARILCETLTPGVPKVQRVPSGGAASQRARPVPAAPARPRERPAVRPPATSQSHPRRVPGGSTAASRSRAQMLRQWLNDLVPPAVQGACAMLVVIVFLAAIARMV